MLSGEGMQRRKTVKNNNRSNQQKQLCTCSTLFCTFLCRCFARLQRETSRNFLVTRFMEEMSYEFPFTFIRSRSFSPCNGGLSMFNMASLEDRRIDQCEKLFDSTVSNPDHKLDHFLPPKTIVIITSEDNATLQIQSCVPSVFQAHFCHLCAGVSSYCIKFNSSKV